MPIAVRRRWTGLALAGCLVAVAAPLTATAAETTDPLSRPTVQPSSVELLDEEIYLAVPEMTPPADLTDAVAIATSAYPTGGNTALAVRAGGQVVGWGSDIWGQASPPADLSDAVSVDVGGGFAMALLADGSVRTWGRTATGVLDVPADLGPVIDIAAGGSQTTSTACGYALALRADGTVVRWGRAPGDGTCTALNARFDPPAGLRDVVSVSAGDTAAAALTADGRVVAWGSSVSANGNGILLGRWTNLVDVATRGGRFVGVKADGEVVSLGYVSQVPVAELPGDGVAVSAGYPGAVLTAEGRIRTVAPNTVTTEPGYQAVAAGYFFVLAIAEPAGDPEPTVEPTDPPTVEPTDPPTVEPTDPPTVEPSDPPVVEPSEPPTVEPSEPPTVEPSEPPTVEPSEPPADGPSLGTDQIQPSTDSNRSGSAEAFRSVAGKSTTATELQLYLDPSSQARSLMVGIYADRNGEPGRLLASGSSSDLVAGEWNSIAVKEVALKAGTAYWLALAAPLRDGAVRFRDLADGDGEPTRTSKEQRLTLRSGLPEQWCSATRHANAPASFYVG